MKKRLGVAALAALLSVLPAGNGKRLTFEQAVLNRGESLLNPLPFIPGWADGNRYFEARNGTFCCVDARNGLVEPLLDARKAAAILPAGLTLLRADSHSSDFRMFAFAFDDDVYLLRTNPLRFTRLIDEPGTEKNPTFSPDGKSLAYTRNGNLYVCDLASGSSRALSGDGSETILNGYASWVYYEEILGRASRYRAFWWSPDSQKIAFLRFDQDLVPTFPLFNANGDYGTTEMQRYPKAGYPVPTVRLGVVDRAGGEIRWAPAPDDEEHYLALPKWDGRGERLYFQWMNREQNRLRLLCFHPAGNRVETIYEERQPTWVEFGEESDYRALDDGGVLLLSSRSGWTHLYRIDSSGGVTQLTQGEWSVTRLEEVDEARGRVFVSAWKEDSTETDLYLLPLAGGPMSRLTAARGTHLASVALGGDWFIDRYSAVGVPPRLLLCRVGPDGTVTRQRLLGDSAAPAFANYELGQAELFRIPTTDGLQLPAHWILPPGFQPGQTYPLVLSVYGGPGAGSVANSFPRGLSDYFLAQQGIIVMSVDHRGSGHFGKKGEALMYRRLGYWEMNDYVEAVKYLRKLPFVDGNRIGITGGSYGGYVAALALMKEPGYFHCGIAAYSVIDWRLYDAVYTERYMDTPQQNPDGYRDASVLNYVDQYRGNLRIVHGTLDDNVHLQNALQLLDRLEEAGKSVELMLYPGERHGIRGAKAAESFQANLDFWSRHFFGRSRRPGSDRDPAGPE
jgi:dipeptidyl-peptidase 4